MSRNWSKTVRSLLHTPVPISSEALAIRLEDEVEALQVLFQVVMKLLSGIAIAFAKALACIERLDNSLEADRSLELTVVVLVHAQDHLWHLDRGGLLLLLDLLLQLELVLVEEDDLERDFLGDVADGEGHGDV